MPRIEVRRFLWRILFGPIGRILPFGTVGAIARPIAALAWLAGIRKKVTLRNLARAFPELSPADRNRIGRESLANLLTVFLEVPTLRHLSDADLKRRLEVENLELLGSIGPRGAILLSGHVGNWELLAYGAAASSGVEFSIVVKEQNDFGELDKMRTSRGNRVIPTGRGARESAKLLGRGGVLAMLADQSAIDRDHMVSMFGIPTYSYAAPARLALRFRPQVIAGFAIRQPDGTYRVSLRDIPHDDLPDTPEGARELTQRYATALETVVREHPEQWVWQHRRWKNTPGFEYD